MKITTLNLISNLHFKSLLFLMAVLFVLPTSCTKSSLEDPKEQESAAAAAAAAAASTEEDAPPERYEYYLDSEQVQEGVFDPEDENLIVDVSGEEDPLVEGGGLYKIWAFTSEETYVDWGNAHGLPVACRLELESHLAEYAEQSGAIDYYEQTGELLPAYEQYANEYIIQMDCSVGNAQERGLGFIYKDYWGGLGWLITTFNSFMYPGWNNSVSRYYTFGIYNGLIVYDKSFFRKRQATLWNWGWSHWRFWYGLSWLNDRMSSSILI